MTSPPSNDGERRLAMSLEDRVKVCNHIMKKMHRCYPMVPQTSMRDKASTFEAGEHSKASSFEGYLQSIGRQLDVLEKQAAERSEAAGVATTPVRPIQGGSLRPETTPLPQLQLGCPSTQRLEPLREQQQPPQPSTQQKEYQAIVTHSGESNETLAAHDKIANKISIPRTGGRSRSVGSGRGRGRGRGRGTGTGTGRGRGGGRGRGKLPSTLKKVVEKPAVPGTVSVALSATNTADINEAVEEVPSKMPRYGWLQRMPIPFFDTLTMGPESSPYTPLHVSSETNAAHEAVWAKLEQMKKIFRGKFRQMARMSEFIVNAQPAHLQEQTARHIMDCLEILDVERSDDRPPCFTMGLLERAEKVINNVIEVFPYICASLANSGNKPDHSEQKNQDHGQPARPLHNAQCSAQTAAKPGQLVSSLSPKSAFGSAPVASVTEQQLLSAQQLAHIPQTSSAQEGPGISLDISCPVNALQLQHSRDPRRRELGKRPNPVQRQIRDPRKRARSLHNSPRNAQAGVPAKAGQPASGMSPHSLLATASVVRFVGGEQPRPNLQTHGGHDSPDIASHEALRTQQFQNEIQFSFLPQQQPAHRIPALQARPGTDTMQARGHRSAAQLVSSAIRLPPPEIMRENMQYVQTRAELALQHAEQLEEVVRDEMGREKEERIKNTLAVLCNEGHASLGSKGRKRGIGYVEDHIDGKDGNAMFEVSADQGMCISKKPRKDATSSKSLKECLEEECLFAQARNPLIRTAISAELGHLLVTCQLLVEEIQLPKLFIRVQRGYPVRGGTTYGFERPPLGWVGVLDEIRAQFTRSVASAPAATPGIAVILDAWAREAEAVIDAAWIRRPHPGKSRP